MKKLVIIIVLLFNIAQVHAVCSGRFINPITDICWRCMFPLKIAGISIPGMGFGNMQEVARADQIHSPICFCKTPFPRVGLSLSFWEPIRLVDVVRDPFCFTSLGGISLNPGMPALGGAVAADESGDNTSMYHVHYYIFPLIYFLNLLLDAVCLEAEGFDLAYLTELDPTWKNDPLTMILHPESIVFANPIAQLACMGDCATASAGLPLDFMFWCAGCQGSVYPLNGHVQSHVGGVQASLLLTERMIYKLHRQGMLWGSFGKQGLCGKYPMPVWRKSQYRTQMTYPIPSISGEPFPCNPMGKSSVLYESGREFPVKGEHFSWFLWRKRDCCAY